MTPETRIIPCVQRVADVEARELEPLWPGVLWRGKTTLLVGDPGLGKSQVTLDVAARITRGETWPCSSIPAPAGDVLILSAEDDLADTIRPRLEAAGADLTRIHFMSTVAIIGENSEDIRYAWPSLLEHVPALREAIECRPGLALIIIDPLTAFLSGIDTHKTSDVRAVLALLAQVAMDYRVAILAVSHLNKSANGQALYRVTGSLAFVAAARAAFVIGRDPEDRDRRLMVCLKNNLSRDSFAWSYTISEADNGAPYVRWGDEPVTISAEELLAAEPTPRQQAKDDRDREVEDWLRGVLQHGPIEATSVWRQAERAGYSERQINRATRSLKVHKAIAGYQGNWHWSLPENDTPSVSGGVIHCQPLKEVIQ